MTFYTMHVSQLAERPDLANFDNIDDVIDGWPCIPRLAAFADELSRVMPNLRFGSTWRYINSDKNTLYVYVDGDPYCYGYIEYGSVGETYNLKYCIYSRSIANWQFKPNSVYRHVKSSSNLKSIVREARSLLRPMLPVEIVADTFGCFYTNHTNDYREKLRDMAAAKNLCLELFTSTLLNDHSQIKNLVLTGDMEGEVLEKFRDFVEVKDAAIAMKNSKQCCTAVMLREVVGEVITTVLPLTKELGVGFGTPVLNRQAREKDVPVQTYFNNELPEEVIGRMAVLSMLPDDGFVSGVGMKVSVNLFYIYDYIEEKEDE
jgi:hypothetical protein